MEPQLTVINKINKKASEITTDDIAESCARYGITLDSLCAKGLEFLGATKSRYDIMTNETIVEPQYQVQLKAWFGFLELLKLVSRDTTVATVAVSHSISPDDVLRLQTIALELKGLETRLNTDSVQRGTPIDVVIHNDI